LSKGKASLGLIVVVGIVLVAILSGIVIYNRLVKMDETIKEAWAQVENQLERRSDLIPNLVNTVKGYAKHEKGIFEHIADARARLAGAPSRPEAIKAANELSGLLGRLLAIAENYPQLKANETFNRLMDELAGTENRIAVERKRYNEKVRDFNRTIRSFPTNLIAGGLGFHQEVYFQAPPEKKGVSEVKF